MSDLTALQYSLQHRLRIRLPASTEEERAGWLAEAAIVHGYELEKLPAIAGSAIVEFARLFGLQAKAAEMAETGSIDVPGKISISKSGASGNYERLIETAQRDYIRAARQAGIRPIIGGVGSVSGGSVARADRR